MSILVDIKKRLGDFVLNVCFESEGGVLGFLGASGCGKSLTLKCIAGIEQPDSGKIVLNGRALFDSERKLNLPPQKRNVGYLFQNNALFPNMTVRENILCGLHREPDKRKREEKLEELIGLMRLEGLEGRKPFKLSGGQAQRVALARILVSEPELLMLDEPFSALDSNLRDKLQLQLKGLLKRFGGDVIFVTHSRDEAYHMCSSIAVMDGGKLLVKKETKGLFEAPEKVQAAVLTGCKNITKAIKAGEYLVDAPEWEVTFKTAEPVSEFVTAVGIRAHFFDPEETENRFPVRFDGGMEEPFESVLEFRYKQQKAGTPALWWRMPKIMKPDELPEFLGISPEKVMPLCD